jgi:hypothetical protein
MTGEAEAFSLIGTKLQRPRLPTDLIHRRRLVDRLQAGLDRKLTLISAQAGAGKTTLLAQWLADAECPLPSAWLSLGTTETKILLGLVGLMLRVPAEDATDAIMDGALDRRFISEVVTSMEGESSALFVLAY